jgi:RNA polymerase-binding protein DksA
MPSRPNFAHSRARLLQRRHELLALYQQTLDHSNEEASTREIEAVDKASEQWEVRVLSQLGEVEARELSLVIAALRRIDDGSYGQCTACEERIGLARLDAAPEAALCIDCASAAERPR